MSLTFTLEKECPPCPNTPGVYYALNDVIREGVCLGRELPYIQRVPDQSRLDFVGIVDEVDKCVPYGTPQNVSYIVLAKLCMVDHPQISLPDSQPGPRLERVAGIVIGALGAQPFVPDIVEPFPSILNEADGERHRLQTLLPPSSCPDHTYDNPPKLAIAARRRILPAYYILDEGVDALVMETGPERTALLPPDWHPRPQV